MLPIKTPGMRQTYKNLYFYIIRLPLIYILIFAGFIFEFLVTFPFWVLTSLDRHRSKRRGFKQ